MQRLIATCVILLLVGCSMSPERRDALSEKLNAVGEKLHDVAGSAASIPDLIIWGVGTALTSIAAVVGASKHRRKKSTALRLEREAEVDSKLAELEAKVVK